MNKNILTFFQAINKGYIHPKGKIATKILLNELAPSDNEKILELGFGTGCSLVETYSCNPSIKLFGVELSSLMLKKASSRIRFCGLENSIVLSLIENKTQIPFPDNHFDKIYIESVLAIQEGNSLEKMIQELKRVLKPKGILCINELLWSTKVSTEKIKATNKYILENFGIIQANGKYPYIKDWEVLFKKNDFTLIKSIDLNEPHHFNRTKHTVNLKLLLSQLYSLWGLLKSKTFMSYRNEWRFYKGKMNNNDTGIKLDPYLLKFIKSN